MATFNIIRVVVHILAVLTTLVAIGFMSAAVFSSGWQVMVEPGTGEIHQHGLWLDYNYVRPHVAGVAQNGHDQTNFQWIFNYKYGSAVHGDEVHRAKSYQENAMILLCVSLVLSVIGLFLSYCANIRIILAIGWAVCMFLTVLLAAAGLVQFYVNAMLPENRYVYTDRKVEQSVGYSYWWAAVGTIGYALALLMSVACIALVILGNRYGEKTPRAAFTFKRGNNTQV